MPSGLGSATSLFGAGRVIHAGRFRPSTCGTGGALPPSAQDALREAERATGAVRASYLIIAEQIRKLAMAADAETKSGG
jgi:hypothetical protein